MRMSKCDLIKKFFDKNPKYKALIHILTDLPYVDKVKPYKELFDEFLETIKKDPTLPQDFKEYVELVVRWYENMSIWKSHMYAFLEKRTMADMMKNTLKLLKEGKINELENQLQKLKVDLAQEPDILKQLNIWWDAVFIHSLQRLLLELKATPKNKHKEIIKNFIDIWSNKIAYKNIESTEFAISIANKYQDLINFLKELWEWFWNVKTIQRDYQRVWSKNWLKTFDNYYELYKQNKNKFADFLNRYKAEKFVAPINISQKDIDKFINEFNKTTWKKIEYIGTYLGNVIVFRDLKDWYLIPVDLDEFKSIREGVLNFYKDLEWGEANLRQIVNDLEREGNVSIEDVVKSIQSRLTPFQKQTRKKVSESIEFLDNIEWLAIADLVKEFSELPENLKVQLYDKYQKAIFEKLGQNLFITAVMSNLNYLEEYAPEVSGWIKKWLPFKNYIGDELKKEYKELTRFFMDKQNVEVILQKIPYYITREIIGDKIEQIAPEVMKIYEEQGLHWLARYVSYKFWVNEYEFVSKFKKLEEQYKNALTYDERWVAMFLNYYFDGNYDIDSFINDIVKAFNRIVFNGELGEEETKLFKDKLLSYMKMYRNLNQFFIHIRDDLRYFDDFLWEYFKKYSVHKWQKSYLKYLLKTKYQINENRVERIMWDLYWETLGKNFINKVMLWVRRWLYKLELNALSLHWWTIAAQNLAFGLWEGLTRFGYNKKEYNKILELLDDVDSTNEYVLYLKKHLWRILRENQFYIQTTKYLDEHTHDWLTKLGIVINDFIEKRFGKETDIWDKITSFINSPIGFADEIVKRTLLEYWAFAKALDNLWIDYEDIKFLIDNKQWQELYNLFQKIEAEATKEANIFFTTSEHAWLTRNIFSRLPLLNFFASWWSKKVWEYLYYLIIEPLDTWIKIGKLTWNPWEWLKAFVNTLLLNDRFQAMLKQWILWWLLYYKTLKLNEDPVEPHEFIMQNLIPVQAKDSFFVTRAISDFVSAIWFVNEEHREAPTILKALFVLTTAFKQFSNQFGKEYKTFAELWRNTLELAEKWELDLATFGSLVSSWLADLMVGPMTYTLFDEYKWIRQQRFDDRSVWGVFEGFLWIKLTKWTDTKHKMYMIRSFDKFLQNPMSYITNVMSFNLLWQTYWTYWNKVKNEKIKEILAKDNVFQWLIEWQIADEVYENNYKELRSLITSADLLEWWDLKWKPSDKQAKITLLKKELEEKWINWEQAVAIVKSWLLRKDEQAIFQIALAAWSRPYGAMLVSFAAQKLYDEMVSNTAKQLGIKEKNLPDKIKDQIKQQVIKLTLPHLIKLDRKVWADVIGVYLKNKYLKDENLRKYFVDAGGQLNRYLMLDVFAQIIDLWEAEFNADKFTSLPALLSQDIKDERLPNVLSEYFDFIDSMNVLPQTKLITKAALLYANFKQIKNILEANPEKFGEAADKLAEIVWDTSDKIVQNPSVLEALMWWRSATSVKLKWITKIKLAKLPKKVYQRMKDLKKTIIKQPKFKPIVVNYIKRKYLKITYKPLKIKLPSYDTKLNIKELKPRTIKSIVMKVAERRVKSKRFKRPRIKPIKKAKTNTRTRTKIKPSRPNR